MTGAFTHLSVMAGELVAAMAPRDGDTIVDGTGGRGGHTRLLLEAADCTVIAIDRDPQAVAACREALVSFGSRVTVVQGRFGDMDRHVQDLGIGKVDAVGLDLGPSSPQLDDADRGFSFRHDGPLDMRMEAAGESAADWINSAPEGEIAQVIRDYGDEHKYRRVARAIVAERQHDPITTTGRLAEIVRKCVGKSADGIDPSTRTFQAIRIKVNDEIGELERGLAAAERILRPGGRLAVLSFHSGEDRVVKQFLRRASAPEPVSRHAPVPAGAAHTPTFTLASRRPVSPSEAETRRNPRARSARLRSAMRTDAPASTPSSSQGAAA